MPGSESTMIVASNVTSPSFSATNEKVSVSPAETLPDPSSSALPESTFVRSIERLRSGNTVSVSVSVIVVPFGSTPVKVALLSILPAFTSSSVTV